MNCFPHWRKTQGRWVCRGKSQAPLRLLCLRCLVATHMEMSGSREYGRLAEIWVEKYVGIGNVYRWHPLTSIRRQEKIQGLSLGLLYLDLMVGGVGRETRQEVSLGEQVSPDRQAFSSWLCAKSATRACDTLSGARAVPGAAAFLLFHPQMNY